MSTMKLKVLSKTGQTLMTCNEDTEVSLVYTAPYQPGDFIAPVSYTHLTGSVEQVLVVVQHPEVAAERHGVEVAVIGGQLLDGAVEITGIAGQHLVQGLEVVPVSYTHLDVYKRQVQRRVSQWASAVSLSTLSA